MLPILYRLLHLFFGLYLPTTPFPTFFQSSYLPPLFGRLFFPSPFLGTPYPSRYFYSFSILRFLSWQLQFSGVLRDKLLFSASTAIGLYPRCFITYSPLFVPRYNRPCFLIPQFLCSRDHEKIFTPSYLTIPVLLFSRSSLFQVDY